MYKHYIEQLESFNKREPPVRKFEPQMQGTELEQLWANLSRGESKSLLKKHLTPERYKLLKDKKTKLGGTLADCIRSGKLYYVQLYACACTCISTGKKLGSENNWYSLLTLRRYNKFEKKNKPLWVMSKRTYGGLCAIQALISIGRIHSTMTLVLEVVVGPINQWNRSLQSRTA